MSVTRMIALGFSQMMARCTASAVTKVGSASTRSASLNLAANQFLTANCLRVDRTTLPAEPAPQFAWTKVVELCSFSAVKRKTTRN